MSTIWKVIGVLVILAIVIFGIRAAKKSAPASTTAQNQQSAAAPASSLDPVAARDNSNDSLNQDIASVDAQLKAFDTSSAQVDQSINDKPVTQTE